MSRYQNDSLARGLGVWLRWNFKEVKLELGDEGKNCAKEDDNCGNCGDNYNHDFSLIFITTRRKMQNKIRDLI